jgi:hypothetical protein
MNHVGNHREVIALFLMLNPSAFEPDCRWLAQTNGVKKQWLCSGFENETRTGILNTSKMLPKTVASSPYSSAASCNDMVRVSEVLY